jgi:hypothetical protein
MPKSQPATFTPPRNGNDADEGTGPATGVVVLVLVVLTEVDVVAGVGVGVAVDDVGDTAAAAELGLEAKPARH